MIGTYAAALAVCAAALAIGQAALALCGARSWSWLAPPVGLALLCAICWATVRMPGDGVVPAVLVAVLLLASLACLRGRLEGGREALRLGVPVAAVALLAASLPFAVEGHFGILGTGFNPDMSQHLLAADRLAGGGASQLLRDGYPLGPHAVVVALGKGLGIGPVPAFSGFTVAVAVLAPLTALAAFAERAPGRPYAAALAAAAALVVGLVYLAASYYAQGAFKETTQGLLVLGFVLALREGGGERWRGRPLRLVPAALIAVGTVYVYSFPGLAWIGAALLVWLALERRVPDRPLGLALAVFAVGALPELGRMIDFRGFEAFDPRGSGLGNLFGQVSPFAALGIWPTGDFRLAPGDGTAPTLAYQLGAAFSTALLLGGLFAARRGRERALIAGVASVVAVYLLARLGGTPYTAGKALAVAAPVLALAIVLPLADAAGGRCRLLRERGGRGGRRLAAAALAAYLVAAASCSLLALANAPVGPSSYSPALTLLRPLLGREPTLVLARESVLLEQQGESFLLWELRGGRVCVEPKWTAGGRLAPGIAYVVVEGGRGAPYAGLTAVRRAGPYRVWERPNFAAGPSPCPLIEVRQVR